MRSNLVLSLIALLTLSACGEKLKLPDSDYMIGEKLKTNSSMSDANASDRTQVVIFDKTTRVIHHFDLVQMKVVKTVDVVSPSLPHSILFDQASGLIVDLADGHLTLIDGAGNTVRDPVHFAGRPVSAAFRPDLGTLVVYDDMSSVGILKLDSLGHVTQRWLGGPLLGATATIKSGDLNDDNQLILALSDGSIATVDVAQTLTNRAWSFTKVATAFAETRWVAPLRGVNDRVMVLSGSTIAIVSTATGITVASQELVSGQSAVFQTKTPDAHVILKKSGRISLVYPTASALVTRDLTAQMNTVIGSRLSLQDDSWSFIDSLDEYSWKFNSNEVEGKGRVLRKYRLSDLAATQRNALPDQAQLDIAENSIFALYPSELGYAVRMNLDGEVQNEFKMFNLGHIKP